MRLLSLILFCASLLNAQAAHALLVSLVDAPNTPADSPGAGTYSSTQSVTVTDASAQFILYTVDGSTPACPSTGTLYSGAFNIAATTTLKTIGCNGITGGGVLTSVYTISASGPSIVQPTSGNPLGAACATYASNPTTCPYPVNVTAGNEVYVLTVLSSSASTSLGTPLCGSGTATIGTFTAIGGGGTVGGGIQQWYRAAITGSGSCTVSVAVTGTAQNVGVFPFEVSNDGGPDTGTNPIYNHSTCFTTTGCALSSIAPATTGDLMLNALMGGASITYSALTPWTLSGTGTGTGNNIGWFTGNYNAPSTSAVTGTFSESSGTVSYDYGAIAIK